MAFDPSELTTDAVTRIRLVVGDIDEVYPIMEDSVYEFVLIKNYGDETLTAIEMLENMVNYASLNPSGGNARGMEHRLRQLKAKLTADKYHTPRIPMMIKSDRKDWSDMDKIFGDKK